MVRWISRSIEFSTEAVVEVEGDGHLDGWECCRVDGNCLIVSVAAKKLAQRMAVGDAATTDDITYILLPCQARSSSFGCAQHCLAGDG